MTLVEWAYEVSQAKLAEPLPRRWAHVQGVAARAREVASAVGDDAALLEAAAVLHDVGYAPDLATTGFHPLDGARYLEQIDAPDRLIHLVAHHSYAALEAELRGLADELADYKDEGTATRDALWCCDLTTTPDGEATDARDRIAEIKQRYGPGDLVTTFITNASPELLAAVDQTWTRVRQAS
ncbi:HD domain-containing protein [Saccharopolyspora halophila]|uniref:HD domain-containing protein n=1 Tax=Saccharopolyspora halophila TaxID=405551 RepID=UPI0031E02FAE